MTFASGRHFRLVDTSQGGWWST